MVVEVYLPLLLPLPSLFSMPSVVTHLSHLGNLVPSPFCPTFDFVTSMRHGIFSGITLTAILVFLLQWRAKCPIPRIIYGFGAGIFGWAIIYLYSTYSANILDDTFPITDPTTLNIGLTVIIIAAIAAFLFTDSPVVMNWWMQSLSPTLHS